MPPLNSGKEAEEASLVSETAQVTATDAELMEAVAKADARAFAMLMQRHLKSMLGLAHRVIGNRFEADEVVQEGFLRLWTHAPEWDPDGRATIKTWLSRVIINLCLDRIRRRRSVPLEDAGEIIDTAASAYDLARDEDKRKLVQQALLTLPDRQRVAISLSYFEELSGAEIADAMHVSVRAVESLLVRARRSLRAYLSTNGIVGNEDI